MADFDDSEELEAGARTMGKAGQNAAGNRKGGFHDVVIGLNRHWHYLVQALFQTVQRRSLTGADIRILHLERANFIVVPAVRDGHELSFESAFGNLVHNIISDRLVLEELLSMIAHVIDLLS